MRLFGLEITRASHTKAISPVYEDRGGWFPVIREAYAGAWQRNDTIDRDLVLAFHAVWTCVTLIAHDISKLRVKLIARQSSGIWEETTNPAYSPVLRDPNGFQNDHQFWESWILSKLLRGNTYVLKRRDNRNVVNALYVLDPNRVKPLVSDDGSIFYELIADNISGVTEQIIVPSRDIIHDRWNCIFHPLIGTSPIFANGLAATQGLRIQRNSADFFLNASNPSGLLVAPAHIEDATAQRLTDVFNENYSGNNSGRIAVVGDNLKFQQLSMSAVDAQLIEQLKWSAEIVCGTFHVPPYKAGIGTMPTQATIESLNIEYYSQALQMLIEEAEGCLDRGLGLGPDTGVEFDLDGLLRMDTPSKVAAMKDAVGAAVYSPNEARRKFDLGPVEGGDTPYLQQQNYSLRALAKRDAKDDPFAKSDGSVAPGAPTGPEPPAPQNDNVAVAAQANAALVEFYRGLA